MGHGATSPWFHPLDLQRLIPFVLNLVGMLNGLAFYHFLEIENLVLNLDLRRRARRNFRIGQECYKQQDKWKTTFAQLFVPLPHCSESHDAVLTEGPLRKNLPGASNISKLPTSAPMALE
jgi:hypothetical protein